MQRVLAALVAALALASGARAAITATSESTLTTGVVGPPVAFSLGPAGSEGRFFSWSLSANATIVSGAMLGRAGADWYAKDVLRVVNARAAPQGVTLSAAQLSNAQLDVFQWHVYDGSTLVATLDLEAANPSVSFTLPASTTYTLDARLDLADGAGQHNAPTGFQLTLRVGSGGIQLVHATSQPALSALTVEVPFGALASGSSVGANSTNASASIAAATVLATTTHALYLNNTNGASPWWVKLVHTSSSSIGDVLTGDIGVDNGTSSVDHIRISSGSLLQSSGSYQRLEPGSTNRIYVESLADLLWNGATIDFDVYASPTATGESFLVSKGRITLT